MIFAYLLLAVFAYRGLLGVMPGADLSREFEEWFFIPTETSPLIVVLLSGWLVYRRRERLESLAGQPAAWGLGLPLLLLSGVVMVWSLKTSASPLLAISLLFAGVGLAGIHFGHKGVKTVVLPAFLLLFALPLPAALLSEVVFRFQIWTAEAAGWLLFMMGLPAYVSGDQVLLAEDHFQVIEGCSGMRSVQTLTMVSVLLAELFGRRGLHAACLVLLAPFIAFGLNSFRVLALILNPRSDVIAVHNLQGIAMLLLGLAILYGIDGFLQRNEADTEGALAPEASPPTGSVVPRGLSLSFLAVLALLSVWVQPWPFVEVEEVVTDGLRPEVEGWEVVPADADFSFLGTVGFRTLIDWRFASESGPLEFFALLGDRRDLSRSPMSPKTVPPGSGWLVEGAGPLGLEGVHSPRWLLVRSGTRRMLVHHWYEGTEGLANEFLRGLVALDRSPWAAPADVLAVRLATEVRGSTRGGREAAEERLRGLAQELQPALDHLRAAANRKRSS